jgi:hypothetical protein
MSKGGETVSTTSVDPQVKQAYLSNLDYAAQVANQLGPQQFAGFTPQYQAGEAMATQAAMGGAGLENLGTAADLTRAAAGFAPQAIRPDAELIQQYYNPYQQEVIDTSLQDLEQARQRAVQQMGEQAQRARAFGGSRQAVAEALTSGEYGKQAGSMIANLRAQGYNQALQAAQAQQAANQAAGMQGAQFRLGAAQQLGGLGQQQQAQDYAAAQALMGLGQARQQMTQQELDAARNLGMQRLSLMSGALGLQPANLGGTQTTPYTRNLGAGALGGALAGAQMAPMLGVTGPMGIGLGALMGLI